MSPSRVDKVDEVATIKEKKISVEKGALKLGQNVSLYIPWACLSDTDFSEVTLLSDKLHKRGLLL